MPVTRARGVLSWLALAGALLLAGCGSGTVTVTSSTSASVTTNAAGQPVSQYTMPPSSTPTSCAVTLRGFDAQVTFQSASLDVTPACTNCIQTSAAGGELWIEGGTPTGYGMPQQVCSLTDTSGRANATITDSGEAIYGTRACTRLIAAGWAEQSAAAPSSPTATVGTSTSSGAPTSITKCGTNTTACPVVVNCRILPNRTSATHGCWYAVGRTGNRPAPPPGPDPELSCSWSTGQINAEHTVYVYICDPGP